MAKATVLDNPFGRGSGGVVVLVEWVLTTADPTGDAFTLPRSAERSVDLKGTFAGGRVDIEGSNKLSPVDADFHVLRDPHENLMQYTADEFRAILPAAFKVRPKVAAGSVTSVTVTMLFLGTGR